MIRAMVFDVDGVLIKPMVFASVLEREYGLTRDVTSEFFQGPFKKCSLGQADMKQELPRYLKKWGWAHSLDNFIEIWFEADSEIDKNMFRFVEKLGKRSMPRYIASTQEEYRARYLEREMGFTKQFDGLFFSCRLGCEKPEKAYYDLIAREVGLEPDQLLFIDDLEANVEGARSAGWNAEWHVWEADPKEYIQKYRIME